MLESNSREDRLKRISEALARLSYRIEQENKAGQNSLNSIAEDILRPILQVIYELPELVSTNTSKANSDSIDLISKAQRLGIQVTSTTKADKIADTLKGLTDSDWIIDISHLKFVILSPNPTNYQSSTKTQWRGLAPTGLVFEPNVDIINGTRELYPLVKTLNEDQLRQVDELLEESVFGVSRVDPLQSLLTQLDVHIGYEINTLKYIPEIFVETPRAKHLARYFSHPRLFVGRVLDSLRLLSLDSLSRDLTESGLPALSVTTFGDLSSCQTWDQVMELASRLLVVAQQLYSELKAIDFENQVVSGQVQYKFDQTRYVLEMRASTATWRLETHCRGTQVYYFQVTSIHEQGGSGQNDVCVRLSRPDAAVT